MKFMNKYTNLRPYEARGDSMKFHTPTTKRNSIPILNFKRLSNQDAK